MKLLIVQCYEALNSAMFFTLLLSLAHVQIIFFSSSLDSSNFRLIKNKYSSTFIKQEPKFKSNLPCLLIFNTVRTDILRQAEGMRS